MQKKSMEKFIRYNILVVGFLFLSVGCKTTQTTTVTNNPDQIIKISLYSIGAGIDRNAETIVQHTIARYQKKGFDFTYIVTHWGREGEKDYCIDAQKLKTADYKELLTEFQTLLKDMQVHVYEKHPCSG